MLSLETLPWPNMSTRAFRRLNRDVDVIHIAENVEEQDEDDVEEGPGFAGQACKKKGPVINRFALVSPHFITLLILSVCVCVM